MMPNEPHVDLARRNAAMLAAWRAGRSVREIANQFQLGVRNVRGVLRGQGVAFPAPQNVDEQTVVRQYASGLTIRVIAEEHDVSYGKIRNTLLAAGVQLRPRGGSHR